MPNGHFYKLVIQSYKSFNRPLVHLVSVVYKHRKKPLTIIDIGSAVGDTVLLIDNVFSNKIEKYMCIDGDIEYHEIAKFNLKDLSQKCTIVHSLLSDTIELVSSIVKIDPTTGSAFGHQKTMSSTVESITDSYNFRNVDIIKIDIDGFDGKAIAGLGKVLESSPYIIFEWNPPLYNQVGNDVVLPFEFLIRNGYEDFVWFNNQGIFSHYTNKWSLSELKFLEKYCDEVKNSTGFHFDIIAVPLKSKIDIMDFALTNSSE